MRVMGNVVVGAAHETVLRKLYHLSLRQKAALAAPPLLIGTMVPAFKTLTGKMGWPAGYLAGMGIYWVGWCIVVPVCLLGGVRPVLRLFKEGKSVHRDLRRKLNLALWWPLMFPLAFYFVPNLGKLSPALLGGSILLGIVIGVTEEILWRGLYVSLFPDDLWLNTIYPTMGFALWHLAPQLVRPNAMPGGVATFLLYAFALGLTYAYYARKTGSIRWCTVSHIVHDTLGLGFRIYM